MVGNVIFFVNIPLGEPVLKCFSSFVKFSKLNALSDRTKLY